MTAPAQASDFTPALDALCAAKLGGPMTDCVRLSGGASQESYRFACGGDLFVLRRPPGGVAKSTSSDALSMRHEAHTLNYVYEAGVPVPEVVHICAPEDGLGLGYIMRFIDGQTIARKILRDDEFATVRPQLAAQCGAMLARLHGLEMHHLEGLPHSDAKGELDKYTGILRSHGHPHPVFELAISWLARNVPPSQARCLVHGDFRMGNLMVAPKDGVVAILDWERPILATRWRILAGRAYLPGALASTKIRLVASANAKNYTLLTRQPAATLTARRCAFGKFWARLNGALCAP